MKGILRFLSLSAWIERETNLHIQLSRSTSPQRIVFRVKCEKAEFDYDETKNSPEKNEETRWKAERRFACN